MLGSDPIPRSLTSYEIGRAKNGFIFGYYAVGTDSYEYIIAQNVQELGKQITRWQAERVAGIIAFYSKLEVEK